ncbi:MAG: MSCRAMM family protein [Terriglobia bacterium]
MIEQGAGRQEGRTSTNLARILVVGFVGALALAVARFAYGQAGGAAQPLQFSISIPSGTVIEPIAAQITLHFHNSGSQPLWLYEPVRDVTEIPPVSATPNSNSGGSSLSVHLELPAAGAGATSPGTATVLRTPGFPHPNLVELAPGGELQETAVVRINPATRKTSLSPQPIWGTYQISVVYSARYSNGNDIRHSLGVDLWHGTVSSNTVQIVLEPIPAASRDSISGTAVGHDMIPDADVLVSLSDDQQRLIEQTVTAADGGLYFDNLPPGRYWVTVRRLYDAEDTGFFEHADLSSSQPEAQLKLIMLSEQVYEAKRLLHKPVLFRITDLAGNPVAGVKLAIFWTSGTVLQNLKADVNSDGFAVVSLLPGTNYVTLSKHGCRKKDEVANVSSGSGSDGFSFTLNCGKKR